MLNVLGCLLTHYRHAQTSEAWFNKSLRPRKPEGSFGRTAQDGHLDSHTAPELCRVYAALKLYILVDVDIDVGNGFCGKQMLICVLNRIFLEAIIYRKILRLS